MTYKCCGDILKEYMEPLLKEGKSWPEVLKALTMKVAQDKTDNYSMEHNYIPFFMRHLIKEKVDLTVFNEIMHDIIHNMPVNIIDSALHRFFDSSDIGLKEYLTQDRFNNTFSPYNEMPLLFLDIKDGKFCFCTETYPYLEAILSNMTEEKVVALHQAKFTFYTISFLNNPDELRPLLKLCQKNPALQKHEKMNYVGVPEGILIKILHYAEEMKEGSLERLINIYKEEIPDFDEMFFKSLTRYYHGKEGDIEFGLEPAIKYIDTNLLFEKFQTRHLEKLDKVRQFETGEYREQEKFEKAVCEYMISLPILLSDQDFFLNAQTIDINKPLADNALMIKLLEVKIQKGKDLPYIAPEIMDYIKQEIKKIKDFSALDRQFNIDIFDTYFNFLKLEKDLPEKSSSRLRKKI